MKTIIDRVVKEYFLIATSLVFVLLATVSLYFFWGIYFEDNNAIAASLLNGEFGEIGTDQIITDYYFPFTYPLAKLCVALPSVPVYGLFYFIQLLFVLLGFSYLVLLIGKKHKNVYLTLGLMILILVLFMDSLMNQHSIRNSILMAFSGLLLHWYNFQQYSISKNKILPFTLFAFSLIVRMHSAVLVLCVFIAYYIFTGKGIKKVLVSLQYYILLSVIYIGVYQLNGLVHQNFGKYIEANYEYAILEKKSFHPLSDMKTEKDSFKYKAIQQFFITDTAEFTKAFFERVVNVDYEKTPFWELNNIKHMLEELGNRWMEVAIPVMPVLLLFFIIGLFSAKNYNSIAKPILFFVIAFAVPVLLTLILVDEMKIRFFSPFISATTFAIVVMIVLRSNVTESKVAGLALLLFFATLLGFRIREAMPVAEQLKRDEMQNLVNCYEIKQYSLNHPVISFILTEIPLSSAIFFKEKKLFYNNLAYFDAGYMTYFSYSDTKFKKLFGCSPLDYKALINMFENRKDVRYYLTDERKTLLENYFNLVYKVNLEFTKADTQPNVKLNGTMYSLVVNQNL